MRAPKALILSFYRISSVILFPFHNSIKQFSQQKRWEKCICNGCISQPSWEKYPCGRFDIHGIVFRERRPAYLRYGCVKGKCWRQEKQGSRFFCYGEWLGALQYCSSNKDCFKLDMDCSTWRKPHPGLIIP